MGSLYDKLNGSKKGGSDAVASNIIWSDIIKWAKQTVKGIDALHNWDPPLVHRDIKSMNLLLDNDMNIKVCDFGLSRFRTLMNAATLGELRGTMAYAPPEIYNGQLFSYKSDIYSLGVVFWEMMMRVITGEYQRPFSEFPEITCDFQIIIKTSNEHLRPTIPEKCPKIIAHLIRSCWNEVPEKRWDCSGILTLLNHVDEECIKKPNDINSLGIFTPNTTIVTTISQ